MKLLSLSGLVAACVLALPAHSTIITLDAADFAPGTLVTGPGISSITGIRGVAQASGTPTQPIIESAISTFITTSPLLPPANFTGAYSFLGDAFTCYNRALQGAAPGSCNDGWSLLEVTFDSPTDVIEVIGGFGDTLGPAFIAFNALGDIVGGCGSVGAANCGPGTWLGEGAFRLSATFDSELVTRVWFGNSSFDNIAISSISYSVPEPGTLALLGLGLAGIGCARRRRVRR